MDLIYLEGVTVDFDGYKAMTNVDFIVNEGEIRFLIGPNGAGKTTLLDVICGKVKPVSGRVIYDFETDLLKLSESEIVKKGISRKFQAPSVFENLTVFENMELAYTRNRGVFSTLFHKLTQNDRDLIHDILKRIGLETKTDKRAGSLAHGEKQWLELSMTLIQEPKLLLVDEPVAGMTASERQKTGELLTEIAKERSVIIVEHDMSFVEEFSSKITVLHEGQIICEGNYEKIRNDPVVIDVYLGREGGKENVLC